MGDWARFTLDVDAFTSLAGGAGGAAEGGGAGAGGSGVSEVDVDVVRGVNGLAGSRDEVGPTGLCKSTFFIGFTAPI